VQGQCELLKVAEQELKRVFGTDKAVVYFVNEKELQKLGNDAESLLSVPLTGLLKEAVAENKVLTVKWPSQHGKFNPLVDLNTSETIKCVPVYSESDHGVIIAFQYVHKVGTSHLDKEVLDFYTNFLSGAWNRACHTPRPPATPRALGGRQLTISIPPQFHLAPQFPHT
jgi:hypothetical protein